MTQYNMLNVKLSNSQLNKLRSGMKNGTEVTLNLPSNLIGNSNEDTNFPDKSLLTDKTFANGSSANIKFSKTQLPKMIQSGEFAVLFIVILLIQLKCCLKLLMKQMNYLKK